MKPLHLIAMGLAIIIFTAAPEGAWDIAEILGHLFLVVGWIKLARALPGLPLRMALTYLVVLATIVAMVLAAPSARAWLDDADPALIWGSSLPALGFQAGLSHALAHQARAAGAMRSAGWWRVAEIAILLAILANVLYDGAGWTWLYGIGTVGLLGVLLVIVLAAMHGSATWAGAPEPKPDPEPEPAPEG